MSEIQKHQATNMILTTDLQQAVQVIKGAIQRSQTRSLQHVNNEVLSLYYGIGQYISENTRHHFWGTGALKTTSDQLQKEKPGLTDFGEDAPDVYNRILPNTNGLNELMQDTDLS